MQKIINPKEAQRLSLSSKNKGKVKVLVGGCFDIIHIGHIKFLQESKKSGDILFILLESDTKVRRLKGKSRPIFSQKERALVLAALGFVDYVIMLPDMKSDKDYEKLILSLQPDVICVTENDPLIKEKKRQVNMIHAKLAAVPHIKTFSTSNLAKILGID
ncbi:adenylyltransferase/cytidyltransferase family protein [Patescibacteria group bacterium]|nr:adenylyltransferase/cytidyltransferase family protein [Patescibacteria group bacterium]